MKHLNLINSFFFLIISIFFSVGSLHANPAAYNKEEVPLEGHWDEDERSTSTEYPISVFWDGFYLYVENTSPCSQVIVSLYDGSNSICQEILPDNSASSIIYVGELDRNITYQLVLTNQFGDRLVGEVK